jgi:hypothetical protein
MWKGYERNTGERNEEVKDATGIKIWKTSFHANFNGIFTLANT